MNWAYWVAYHIMSRQAFQLASPPSNLHVPIINQVPRCLWHRSHIECLWPVRAIAGDACRHSVEPAAHFCPRGSGTYLSIRICFHRDCWVVSLAWPSEQASNQACCCTACQPSGALCRIMVCTGTSFLNRTYMISVHPYICVYPCGIYPYIWYTYFHCHSWYTPEAQILTYCLGIWFTSTLLYYHYLPFSCHKYDKSTMRRYLNCSIDYSKLIESIVQSYNRVLCRSYVYLLEAKVIGRYWSLWG